MSFKGRSGPSFPKNTMTIEDADFVPSDPEVLSSDSGMSDNEQGAKSAAEEQDSGDAEVTVVAVKQPGHLPGAKDKSKRKSCAGSNPRPRPKKQHCHLGMHMIEIVSCDQLQLGH